MQQTAHAGLQRTAAGRNRLDEGSKKRKLRHGEAAERTFGGYKKEHKGGARLTQIIGEEGGPTYVSSTGGVDINSNAGHEAGSELDCGYRATEPEDKTIGNRGATDETGTRPDIGKSDLIGDIGYDEFNARIGDEGPDNCGSEGWKRDTERIKIVEELKDAISGAGATWSDAYASFSSGQWG